jgi:hypothetical protein
MVLEEKNDNFAIPLRLGSILIIQDREHYNWMMIELTTRLSLEARKETA